MEITPEEMIRTIQRVTSARAEASRRHRARQVWDALNDSVRNSYEDQLAAIDSVNAAAETILAHSTLKTPLIVGFRPAAVAMDGPEDRSGMAGPSGAYTIDTVSPYVTYTDRPRYAVQLADGTIRTEHEPDAITSHGNVIVGGKAPKWVKILNDFMEKYPELLFDRENPKPPLNDPEVRATVCYCDSDHPQYQEPTVMSQYKNCPLHPIFS